jgi:hypothetical protein
LEEESEMTNRKQLAAELGRELGVEVKYLGVPSCAYRVGDYTIRKDGTIDGNLEAIHDFLIKQGLIQDEPAEANADPAPASESDIDTTELSVPLVDFTPQQLINLIRILYSRQKLLAAMLKYDGIRIDEELIGLLNDEKPNTTERIQELLQSEIRVGMVSGVNIANVTFSLTLAGTDHSSDLYAYVRLMAALLSRAKAAGFVSARLIDPAEGEMKYYVNSFLNQLGFGGADHKNDRRVLMGHIKGYAAFKSADGMEAHKTKYAALRKAKKQAEAEAEKQETETPEAKCTDAELDLKAEVNEA